MTHISLSGVHPAQWVAYDTAESVAEGAYALLPLDRLEAEIDQLAATAGQLAVVVSGDTDHQRLAPLVGRLAMVAVHFPAFNDGRGFSLAGRLRRDLGFTGELRAVGHVIPDQAKFLARAGFDTAEVEDARAPAFEQALKRYAHFYQCTINGDMSVAHKRHMSGKSEDAA